MIKRDVKDQTERTKNHILMALCSLGIFNPTITSSNEGPYIIVELPKDLSESEMSYLANELFFTEAINIQNLKDYIFTNEKRQLFVCYENFGVFRDIYFKLQELNRKLIKASIGSTCVTFVYDRNYGVPLNYIQLDSIQNLVEPTIKDHDSIRVIGMFDEYTLFAHTNWSTMDQPIFYPVQDQMKTHRVFLLLFSFFYKLFKNSIPSSKTSLSFNNLNVI